MCRKGGARPMMPEKLSIPGGLVGALVGLGVETAIRELTGTNVIHGLLELVGAGVGLLRLDRKIYDATVRLLRETRVDPDEDYRDVLQRIDRLTADLPELRQSFLRLVEAGLRAREA
jgi:hypothetical protein